MHQDVLHSLGSVHSLRIDRHVHLSSSIHRSVLLFKLKNRLRASMTPPFVIATPHCPVLLRFQGYETVSHCEIKSSIWLGAAGPCVEGIRGVTFMLTKRAHRAPHGETMS
jgi:hypothetical protein